MRANLKSITDRCYLFEAAFNWELTQETIHLPLGFLKGGVRYRNGRAKLEGCEVLELLCDGRTELAGREAIELLRKIEGVWYRDSRAKLVGCKVVQPHRHHRDLPPNQIKSSSNQIRFDLN